MNNKYFLNKFYSDRNKIWKYVKVECHLIHNVEKVFFFVNWKVFFFRVKRSVSRDKSTPQFDFSFLLSIVWWKRLIRKNIVITLLKRILIICETSYYVGYEIYHYKNKSAIAIYWKIIMQSFFYLSGVTRCIISQFLI